MPQPGVGSVRTSGDSVLKLAREHIGENYVLGVTVPKNNPNWKGPFDCAEFASWVTYQVAGVLYGCSDDSAPPEIADAFTGYWARDADILGRKITIDEAAGTAGAFILRIPQPGAKGHIVISNGAGGTVEAHSTKRGVIESTLTGRRWDMGILIPQISYGPAAAVAVSPPEGIIYRLTTPRMAGDVVRKLQSLLLAAGFDPGPVDGEFGAHTQAAVVAF